MCGLPSQNQQTIIVNTIQRSFLPNRNYNSPLTCKTLLPWSSNAMEFIYDFILYIANYKVSGNEKAQDVVFKDVLKTGFLKVWLRQF